MSKFLEGVETDALVWVERAKKEDLKILETMRKTSRRRMLLAIVGVGGVAFWRMLLWFISLYARRPGKSKIPMLRKLARQLGGGFSWSGAVGFSIVVGLMQSFGLLL